MAVKALSGTAMFSECGLYRYQLWRKLRHEQAGGKGTIAYCMLNPSTADAMVDDPTVARCVARAHSLGYDKCAVVNLYPLRATDPGELWAWAEANPEVFEAQVLINLMHVHRVLDRAQLRVAAWGAMADGRPMAKALRLAYAGSWHCLGVTKDGAPRHPLYVRTDAPLVQL